MTTLIRHATTGGAEIAYQVTGRGLVDLVLVPGFVSHLELDWEYPGAARLFERLGSFARLIRFDPRGVGLSVRTDPAADLHGRAGDVIAVLDAVGVRRAAVLGYAEGGQLAVRVTAAHPDRVSALVLFGAAARNLRGTDYPWGETWDERMDRAAGLERGWGEDVDLVAPGADDELRAWYAVRARAALGPAAARSLLLASGQDDVRGELASVGAPTLVLHRRGDRVVSLEEARYLAQRIRGARLVELDGDAHVPYVDPDEVADELQAFLTGSRPVSASQSKAVGEPGSSVAGYRIERLVARGGMGAVYVAHDVKLGRRVALKVIVPELATDERFRERFLREWRIAAALEHPSIVPVHDAGEADDHLYIAMRYVEGTDLRALLAEQGRLEPARALAMAGQVASALDAAHARGLVHRDVKPGNVLIDREGHCYLCDFGLTKDVSSVSGLTATGQLVGTLDYIAPEQIRAGKIDGRADQYSLACVLYECLAGRAPFKRDAEAQVLWAHMQDSPPSLRELEVLDPVLARGLAKEPDERYGTCSELVAAARDALGLSAVQVPVYRRPRLGRRLILAGALLLTLAVAAAAFQLLRGGGGGGVTEVVPNSVGIIDAKTNRLVGQVPVGKSPSSISYGAEAVWVLNGEDRTVSRIDPRTREVRTIAIGANPSDLAAGGGVVWVANGPVPTLSRLDPASNDVETIRLPHAGVPPGSWGEAFVAATPSGAVVSWGGGDVLQPFAWRVEQRGGSVVVVGASRPRDGGGPIAVGSHAVWVHGRDSFARLDPSTLELEDLVDLPSPYILYQFQSLVAIAAGNDAVWATSFRDATVSRIDVGTNRVLATVPVGGGPKGVAVGGGAVWVVASLDGDVLRLDPGDARVVARIHVGGTPNYVTVGGGKVWVTVD